MSSRQKQFFLVVLIGLVLAMQYGFRSQTAATDRMVKDAGSNLENVFNKAPPPK